MKIEEVVCIVLFSPVGTAGETEINEDNLVEQWEAIKVELAFYDEVDETNEILSDPSLLRSIETSRKQAQNKIGRPLSEVEV